LTGVLADLAVVVPVSPSAAARRRQARALAELVALLEATGAPAAELRPAAHAAAEALRALHGRPEEIAGLDRLAAP
jgi:hypothetical protein